jgi:hypothetical protein
VLHEEVLKSQGLPQAVQTDASSLHNHGLIELTPHKNYFPPYCHTCAGSFITFNLFSARVHSSHQAEKQHEKDWHEHQYVQPIQMLNLYT